MLENAEVAIMNKVNELAERYRLKPYDFVATIQYSKHQFKAHLAYEIPAQGDPYKEEQWAKMMHSLGIQETGVMEDTHKRIIDALDSALTMAPKPRNRPSSHWP